MKLKCWKHGLRVTSGEKSFIHRTGDHKPCHSLAQIGDTVVEHNPGTWGNMLQVSVSDPVGPAC